MEKSADTQEPERTAPPMGGIHHVGLTVSDVDSSEAWYRRVLGLERVFIEDHNGGTGHTVVMNRPGTALHIGLDYHEAHEGERFAEHHTGLDHLAVHVAERDDLDAWAAHLEALGVPHSPITDRSEPFSYATLVFRDPDNIQLELIWQ